MCYYELLTDETLASWTLAPPFDECYGDGTALDIWAFCTCQKFAGAMPVPFRVCEGGVPVDYNDTAFGALVVSERLATALTALAGKELQRISVHLSAPGTWEVLNLLTCIDCIDHARSVIEYYPVAFEDPSRAGKPRGVLDLRVRRDAVEGKHLFRPKDWQVAVIGSELVKQLILDNGFTGVSFRPVT
jgi:hypothetical protein